LQSGRGGRWPAICARPAFRLGLAAFIVLVLGLAWMTWRPGTSASLPPAVAVQPAAEVLTLAYQGAPPTPATTIRPRMQLDLLAKANGANQFHRMSDGESLASQVDDYVLVVRPLSDGYLYIFQVDANGQQQWLFPQNPTSSFSSGSNPVAAAQTIQLPAKETGRVFYLDTNTGIEHIYAVFSASRWPELEAALAEPSPAPMLSQTTRLAMRVEQPNQLGTRGVGGTRIDPQASTALDHSQNGKTYHLTLSQQVLQASAPFMVIERWFRHVEERE